MKKFVFIGICLLLSIGSQAQSWLSLSQKEKIVKDTITFERDTLIKYRVSADYAWFWHIKADTLEGTLDGVAKIKVCNYDVGVTPPDSLFVDLGTNMVDTLSAVGPIAFYEPEGSPYMWVALELTLNNITKWDLTAWLNFRKE